MSLFHFVFVIWFLLSVNCFSILGSASWCPHDYVQQNNRQFQQKTDRFWEFQEQSNAWVEVELPYDLISCVNDNCTKVGSIHQVTKHKEEQLERKHGVTKQTESLKRKDDDGGVEEGNSEIVLPLRKRISLTKMSETSIWITGESGSIYERFWNGVQWVLAPHDLHVFAGHAISVYIVNQTILALSEDGILYQVIKFESNNVLICVYSCVRNLCRYIFANIKPKQIVVLITSSGICVYFARLFSSLILSSFYHS